MPLLLRAGEPLGARRLGYLRRRCLLRPCSERAEGEGTMTGPAILGLDPSLTSTGWCRPNQQTGLIITGKLTGPERLVFIREAVRSLLAGVELVVIEAVPTHGAMSIAPLAGLGSVLRVAIYEAGIPYVDVSPSTRAKFACGDQKHRDKDAVLARAIRAGSTANTNDEADAYWLHRIATAAYQPIDALPKYQAEAVTGIAWPTIGNHQPSTSKPNTPSKRSRTIKCDS